MSSDIWLSIFMGALYLWGAFSSKLNSIARSEEGILLLPLFLLQGQGNVMLTVVNIILALSQIALLLYVLISFWFLQALVTIGWALLVMLIVQVVLAVAFKNMFLKYLLCAVMTIVVGIKVLGS